MKIVNRENGDEGEKCPQGGSSDEDGSFFLFTNHFRSRGNSRKSTETVAFPSLNCKVAIMAPECVVFNFCLN